MKKKLLNWTNIKFFEKNNIHFKVLQSTNGDIITLRYCEKCHLYQYPDDHSFGECILRKKMTPKKLNVILKQIKKNKVNCEIFWDELSKMSKKFRQKYIQKTKNQEKM